MLYSQLQIDDILDSAYSTMWQLSEKAMNDRIFYGEDIYSPEVPIIFDITRAVEWARSRFFSQEDFQGLVAYLVHKIKGYGFASTPATQTPPVIITQPSSQSVNAGANVNFTVVATGTLPLSYQWYKDGVAIPGATSSSYTANNVQVSDSGSVYTVTVSNQVGFANSNNATLTVTAALVGYYYYGTTDYFPDLNNGIDDVPYQDDFPITTGQPLVVPFPSGAANNQFNIVKYPASQSDKTIWVNVPGQNFGQIPDLTYRSIITIGAWKYIISRVEMSLDNTNPTVTYS